MGKILREIPINYFSNGIKAMAEEECASQYDGFHVPITDTYCNWTFDRILCWPPTKAGTTTSQRCPSVQGSDTTKYVYKRCVWDGTWEGLTPNDTSRGSSGYTNYNVCLVPEIRDLLTRLDSGGSDAKESKMDVARKTRILEMVGLSISVIALIISLVIFYNFRGLRNNRTRIHKNLFLAMVVQVNIRLTLYTDQMFSQTFRNNIGIDIEHTPYLCEGSYVLLEYARTAMFMWMFVEGLYLHNVITVTVFQEHSYYVAYSFLGWGTPAIMTASWAVTMALNHPTICWYGYNLMPYFWIVEGPRLTVILLNFLFLLNIIRVLVVKLRQSHTSEIEQVRKAVRAALVLLPLLGIANIVQITGVETLDKAVWEFALWSYTAHFITSFQGFFISCIYCFFNGEVRTAITKSISLYTSLHGRQFHQPRRNSFVSGYYDTGGNPPVITTMENEPNDVTIVKPLQPNRFILANCTENLSDTRPISYFGNETRV